METPAKEFLEKLNLNGITSRFNKNNQFGVHITKGTKTIDVDLRETAEVWGKLQFFNEVSSKSAMNQIVAHMLSQFK